MPSTPLPENVIRSLSRFLFACIPPGQAVVQLFDPNYGDLYLVKGSDDSELHSSPSSPGHDILSDLGLRSPPQALLNELVDCLTLAMQADKCHITIAPDAPTSPSPLTLGTLSSLTDLSDMSFADPGSLDTSAPLSDLRGSALFYGAESGDPQGVFSPSPPPPVSPTPHRSGSTLRLHGDSATSRSHPSSGDASSSSTDGTAGSVYSQPSDNPSDEPYVTCASIAIQPSFTSEGSPVLGGGGVGDTSSTSSPLKLFGLSSLPTGLSPSPSPHGPGAWQSSFRTTTTTTTDGGLSPLSASPVTADFLAISPSPAPAPAPASASPDAAAHLHAAGGSPATSTPVRDAMRRALAVMIMHRHSPQRGETPSPLARAELVRLPAGEAAARIVAAVKARERERTRAWAAAQRGGDAGAGASKARL